jgi:hypothetical protein
MKSKNAENYFLREVQALETLLGLLTIEEEGERVGKILPQLRRLLLDVLGPLWDVDPPILVQTCNKSASKTCWKSCKNTKNLGKFLLAITRNFLCKFQQVNKIYMTYPNLLECQKRNGNV